MKPQSLGIFPDWRNVNAIWGVTLRTKLRQGVNYHIWNGLNVPSSTIVNTLLTPFFLYCAGQKGVNWWTGKTVQLKVLVYCVHNPLHGKNQSTLWRDLNSAGVDSFISLIVSPLSFCTHITKYFKETIKSSKIHWLSAYIVDILRDPILTTYAERANINR